MKRLLTILVFLASLCSVWAQAPITNKAFKNGERLKYTLRFCIGPIWTDVGTADWSVEGSTYQGQTVHKVVVKTMTTKFAEKLYVLRDTMATYVTPQLVPLFYDKKGREGKHYMREWVKYSYADGHCKLHSYHRTDLKTPVTCDYNSTTCAYDMVSMLLRARSMDATNWKVGRREDFIFTDTKKCRKQGFIFRGRKTITLDTTKKKYRTLVFSYIETEDDGKSNELVKFYISDDDNHLPLRLDMSFGFGSAKAYLTSASGLRNPQSSIVK